MQSQWSIRILNGPSNELVFWPWVPGGSPGAPLIVKSGDLVTWNNMSSKTVTLKSTNPANVYLTDPIAAGQVSSSAFVADAAVTYTSAPATRCSTAFSSHRRRAYRRDRPTFSAKQPRERAMTSHAASSRAVRGAVVVKSLCCVSVIAAALVAQVRPGEAQAPPCPAPAYANPATEIISSGGLLRGTVNLTEQFIALPQPRDTNCTPRPSQIVRIFQGYQGLVDPVMPPPNQPPALKPVAPGPTLRAKLGDIVQLSFINQVNQNNFDRNLDIDACTQVGQGGSVYPQGAKDVDPNCLHASSTANIHFHGTHTSPKSTADNVYLMIRPVPRDIQGNLTVPTKALTQSFEDFFGLCARILQENPLNQWPVSWNDLPAQYTGTQQYLLQQYQTSNPTQPIWDANVKAMQQGVWPQYYIGAYPYCFALPEYKSRPGRRRAGTPRMGQSPGTHWYHAHKHGSTAINVGNGMAGAFIIEGASTTAPSSTTTAAIW